MRIAPERPTTTPCAHRSYLTCDGLLHDDDHCLERLSCEFSDPKNIEKANKLDRAVSSM
jgi:hypothetical protein